MLNKLHRIISKTCHTKRRRHKSRNVLVNIFVMFLLTVVLPSLLIFWAVTESVRIYSNEKVQITEDGVLEKEKYNWKPLLEKINERKRSLATSCQYLLQHHKTLFSNDNVSHQNYDCFVSVENSYSKSVICDATGLTKLLICPSSLHGDSITCSVLKTENVKVDDLLHTNNTFLVIQHPFKRIVSLFKSLILSRKDEVQKLYKDGAKDELLFVNFVAFILYENQDNNKWIAIQKGCSVCSTTFDCIISMENIQEEKDYFLYRTTGTEPPYHSIDNLEMLVPSDFEVDFYISKLPKFAILQLYQLFRLDFELFHYRLNTYLSMGIEYDYSSNESV